MCGCWLLQCSKTAGNTGKILVCIIQIVAAVLAPPQTSLLAAEGLCEEPIVKNAILISDNLWYSQIRACIGDG